MFCFPQGNQDITRIRQSVEVRNIIQTNTLTEDIQGIQEKDRHDVILANPPFGGKERKEIRENFTINTGKTAFLFLQHFIKSLKTGGRGAIVIKNTFLSNKDVSISVFTPAELLQLLEQG